MSRVKMLVMDVDGTLTDGQIYVSGTGESFKTFHVRDGYAIKYMLPEAGIVPAIITGRSSDIVTYRSNELGIQYVCQNISDKAAALLELKQHLNLQWEEIAFIGDDLNDLPALELAGCSACPADAVPEVQAICDYICKAPGGRGAVREFIEWLIRNNNFVADTL